VIVEASVIVLLLRTTSGILRESFVHCSAGDGSGVIDMSIITEIIHMSTS